MPDTLRQQIVDAVIARMETIRTANGYQTDIGARVDDWPRRYDRSELPAVAVCDLTDSGELDHRESGIETHSLHLQVRVLVADGDTPAAFLRQAMGDVIKAIGTDRYWGGLATGTYPRQSGPVVPTEAMTLAGAAIEFEVTFVTATFNPFE